MARRLRAGQLECRAGSRNIPLLSGVRRVSLRVACALARDRVSDGPHARAVPTDRRRPRRRWTYMRQPHRAVFRSTVGPPDSRHPATGRRATPPYPRLRVEESERCVACGVRIQARASTPHRTEFSARAVSSSSSVPHGNLVRPRYDAPVTTGLSPTRSGRNSPARIRASASNAPVVTVQPPLPSHHRRRTARLFGRRGPTTRLAWRTANSQSQESKGPTSSTSSTRRMSPTRRMRGTRTIKTQRARRHQR